MNCLQRTRCALKPATFGTAGTSGTQRIETESISPVVAPSVSSSTSVTFPEFAPTAHGGSDLNSSPTGVHAWTMSSKEVLLDEMCPVMSKAIFSNMLFLLEKINVIFHASASVHFACQVFSWNNLEKIKNGQLDIRNPVHTHMRAPAYIMRIYACFICPYVHLKNKINKNSKINIKISGHNTDTSGQMDVLLS